MIEQPQVTRSHEQHTAVVRLTVPRSEIRNVMGPGLQEIHRVLDEQGVARTGPWCTHHLRMDPEVFDFEICVPVAAPVRPEGRVQPGELPERTVARTVHHGDYERLGAAWGEFEQWVRQSGLRAAPDLWEEYTVGPESSSNPADWRTQLNQPLED